MLVKLPLLHIKTMLQRTPLQFLMIVLTQIFAANCILAAYGVSQNIFKKQEQEVSFQNRWFYASLTPWQEQEDGSFIPLQPVDLEQLETTLDAFLPEVQESLSYYFVEGTVEASGKSYSITGTELPYVEDDSIDDTFSYADFKEGAHKVQVSYFQFPCSVGQMIEIGGEQYEVIRTNENAGMDNYVCTFNIPFRAFPENVKVTSINFVFQDMPTHEEAEEFSDKIYEYFGGQTGIVLPNIPDLVTQQFNRLAVMICVMIAILVVLNVSMVYLYTLQSRKSMLGIYQLCGCAPQTALGLFSVEWLFVLTLCFGVALLLFRNFFLPWLNHLSGGISIFYQPSVYWAIYGMYLGLSVCFLLFQCVHMVYHDALQLVKEGAK